MSQNQGRMCQGDTIPLHIEESSQTVLMNSSLLIYQPYPCQCQINTILAKFLMFSYPYKLLSFLKYSKKFLKSL